MYEHFVGRHTELTAANELLQRARAGHSRPLLMTGASGSGKTMLLRRVTADAERAGFRVIDIRGERVDDPAPYGALNEALHAWGHNLPLAPVGGHVGRADDPIVAMGALRQLLEATATETPVLVALDDIHLVDAETADSGMFLMRHLRRHPVMTVATSPSELGGHRLADDLRRLHDAGQLDRVELGPFGDDELVALVRAHTGRAPDDVLVTALRERTGGLPFFAAELVRALAPTLVVRPDGRVTTSSSDQPMPRRASNAVLHRVFVLGADARRVATAIALLGHVPVDRLAVLAAVTGLTSERTEESFDRLVRARVLIVDGALYRFTHTIVRDALRFDLPPPTRRRLHHAIAEAMAALRDSGAGGDIAEIGEHLRQGTGGHDPRAASLLIEAGDVVATSAPVEAAQWYGDALARLRPDDPVVVETQVRLGRALAGAGRSVEAMRVATAAITKMPRGEPRERAVVVAARAAFAAGRRQHGLELLQDELGNEASGKPRLLLCLAELHTWMDEPADAARCSLEARRRGVRDDDPTLVAVQAAISARAGDFDTAAALASQLRTLIGNGSSRSQRNIALATSLLAAVNFDPQIALADASVTAGSAMAGWFQAASAWAHLRLGRLDDAIRTAEMARASVDPGIGHPLLGLIVGVLVVAHIERDELTSATHVAHWAEGIPLHGHGAGLDCALARLHYAQGNHAAGDELLERTARREADRGHIDGLAMTWAARIEAASAAGDGATARATNERLQQLPRGNGKSAIAMNMRCLLSDALARRDDSVALVAREYALERGLALDAARALALVGELGADASTLLRARDEFTRLGAATRQRQASERLRSLAKRARGRVRKPPSRSLSLTEIEVTHHVAGGLTNRQVARRMNLSPKTIEVYLSRIYAKTGCRSRVELAVAVRDGQLLTPA